MALSDFIADTSDGSQLRAWVFPADYRESDLPTLEPRKGGWRILIAHADQPPSAEPIRATWEPTLAEALAHMDLYWPEVPRWRHEDTGEEVDLHALVDRTWAKIERE